MRGGPTDGTAAALATDMLDLSGTAPSGNNQYGISSNPYRDLAERGLTSAGGIHHSALANVNPHLQAPLNHSTFSSSSSSSMASYKHQLQQNIVSGYQKAAELPLAMNNSINRSTAH